MELHQTVIGGGGNVGAVCRSTNVDGASVTVLECAPPEFVEWPAASTSNMRCMHDGPPMR